ncbi:acyltransferase domain-containing protein [Legionella fallonii]|uniref:Malonyl-CoA:ACP transacylase (MAT) domain-containing protein n=1 Tax=Legionella fallonii LLAP-10 TaxID=1212491 RepID=A0A098FZG4_9GAMM|nr:acyltransferase domain-containing protein [Legionella fallonii]CEG55618.1 conserved protein of unknown function [Legionella fallonii LLAP-10]
MSLLIAFSGQGMQYSGMFSKLAADDWGKRWLEEASQYMHLDLLNTEVVQHYCDDVVYAQCFIMLLSAGAFQAINQYTDLSPEFLCGYSLGELTAFGVSARFDLNTLCSLTQKRASFMAAAMSHLLGKQECGLAVLKGNISLTQARLLTAHFNCHIAIINGEDHYVVGGTVDDLHALLTTAQSKGISKAELLRVRVPSHTPLLSAASEDFLQYLQSVSSTPMAYPVLNALTNEVIYHAQDLIPILANELSHTLHWDRVMHLAPEYGISFFLELGPRSSLKKMFADTNPQIKAYALDDFSSIAGLAQFVQSSLT